MLRGLFVTGTDTGVGKTVVSAALMWRLRSVPGLRYWKPVQTGVEHDDDTAEVVRLAGLDRSAVLDAGVRLPRPLSPHLSAALSGVTIDVVELLTLIARHTDDGCWIVEGAGGVMVPLNDRELMVDLMQVLGMPVIVAARSGLGTINHTLLTLEALRSRMLPIAGVVMVGPPNADNRIAIEQRGHVAVLGDIPTLSPLTPETLRAAADGLQAPDVGSRGPAGSPHVPHPKVRDYDEPQAP